MGHESSLYEVKENSQPMFNDIFEYVKNYLNQNDTEASKIAKFPFRKRSEHIWRVFKWAERLIDNGDFCDSIDKDSVLIAALFHDVGYALELDSSSHAENSAIIFRQYAKSNHYNTSQSNFIEYLIRNHSYKNILYSNEIPLELVILMEADLLDETGALSIVWDCMVEGAQIEQSFTKTYKHIKNYSCKTLSSNPMRTEIAKKYWSDKQNLMREFIKQLEFDLDIDESNEHNPTEK